MFSRERGRRRIVFALAAAVLLLAGRGAGAAPGEEPEVIKGTVANIRPTALYLTDVGSPDDDRLPVDAMIRIDEDTEYYDGTRRVTRDDVVTGLRVIVRCRNGASGRTALQVRIIGGKAP